MNAVEIEEAVSRLAEMPFDPEVFPYAFFEAFGNKEATLKRLRAEGKASTNQSDLPGRMANEKANDGVVNGVPLASHSLAGEDASAPRANEDVGAPDHLPAP